MRCFGVLAFGKNVLYMNYQSDESIKKLLNMVSFKELFRKQKIETSSTAINANEVTTVFVLAKKLKQAHFSYAKKNYTPNINSKQIISLSLSN